jgi:hypothetical protein
MASAAQKVTDFVAERWVKEMKIHEGTYQAIHSTRSMMQGNLVASALFGDADSLGNLAVTRADIFVDLGLFDKKRIVKLSSDVVDRSALGDGGALGLSEIVAQYMPKMMVTRTGSKVPGSAQDAEIAHDLVDLSIKSHPRKELLGGDIDELKLTRGVGITWIHRKKNCKEGD